MKMNIKKLFFAAAAFAGLVLGTSAANAVK